MLESDQYLLVTGLLFLISIISGKIFTRFGTPLLLVFIGIGMLAGEDGPGGIQFSDFNGAYLIGSIALAVILFDGGLATPKTMVRQALAPAFAMATLGVVVCCGLVGAVVVLLFHVTWPEALLLGAVIAPTDAAAVTVLLRMSGVSVPTRVFAVLEVESGFNDPMSVFLTVTLVEILLHPGNLDVLHTLLGLGQEMGGGVLLGVAGGYALLGLLRWLKLDATLSPVLALGGALAVFGGAQVAHTSGFLAVYIAGLVLGNNDYQTQMPVKGFFSAFVWLAQITLFLMLGLLVTPHDLIAFVGPALIVAAMLIFVARPIAAALCLLPLGFSAAETGFIAWVGLRGAVPIYLTLIPVLSGEKSSSTLFCVVVVIVIASVAIQGWTIGPVARLLRLKADPGDTAH